jgi:CheY-like chemotaxis protein
LADDSVTIQRVIELTFAEEDVRVVTVGDGQSAIDRLEANPPDIVLADVDMPKRDGYEVAAYVKSRPKLAHIPVVLLTGAFEPIDQARASAAGSSDVLAKPFEPQMVINRVMQLLGRKREEDLPAPAPQSVAVPEAVPPPPPAQPSMRPPSSTRPPARSSMALNDEHATQQDQPARETPGQSAQEPVSLDDYFDQLDAAFSSLHEPGSAPARHDTQTEEEWIDIESPAADLQLELEPVLAAPPPPPPPVSVAPPAVEQSVAVIGAPPPKEPAPVAPAPYVLPAPAPFAAVLVPSPAPVPIPVAAPRTIVNPFAELSAAKAEAAARPPAPVITDDVIEEVVARVLQRLTDKVVRDTVTEIVSKTAERLVQEEILRIKTEGQ